MTSNSTSKTILLIGARRGLGGAIAEEHIDCGSRVVATVRRQRSVIGTRTGPQHGVEQPREPSLQILATQGAESGLALDPLADHASLAQHPEVMRSSRLHDG